MITLLTLDYTLPTIESVGRTYHTNTGETMSQNLAKDLLTAINATPVTDLAELRKVVGSPADYDRHIIALCDSGHIVLSQDCDPISLGDKLIAYVTDPDNASIVYTCASPRR